MYYTVNHKSATLTNILSKKKHSAVIIKIYSLLLPQEQVLLLSSLALALVSFPFYPHQTFSCQLQ